MAKYFNYFPKTFYNVDEKKNSVDVVTNIIARFSFEPTLKQNSSAFYQYQIKDGDTPEIIASKYYGNSERHWVVLLFNDIIDPQYDWPLQHRVFNEFVDKKYSAPQYADTSNTSISGLSWAKTVDVDQAKAYFKVITTTTSEKTTIEKFEVDRNTYADDEFMQTGTEENYLLDDETSINIKITKEFQTFYDYENELNESKRTINLLKPEFIPSVEKEFKRVVKL